MELSSKKPSKQEVAEVLNQILGTSIKWEKLPMNDLEQVYKLISNPVELGKRLVQNEALSRINQRVEVGKGKAIEFIMDLINR